MTSHQLCDDDITANGSKDEAIEFKGHRVVNAKALQPHLSHKRGRRFRYRWHGRKRYHEPPYDGTWVEEPEVDNVHSADVVHLAEEDNFSIRSYELQDEEGRSTSLPLRSRPLPVTRCATKRNYVGRCLAGGCLTGSCRTSSCCRGRSAADSAETGSSPTGCCRPGCCQSGSSSTAAFTSACFRFWKRVLSFSLSTVGLSVLMFFYTVFGGFLFHYIESPREVATKHGVRVSRQWHVEMLWNITEQLNILHPDNWSRLAEEVVANYTLEVYKATKFDGWDGKGDGESELQWSFAGSMLYSATVITTIGYGHIAPKTDEGRLATILYAVVGIPLTLLSITHLGSFMATVFRFLYKNVLCGIFCSPFRRCRQRNNPIETVETRSSCPSGSSKEAAKEEPGFETGSGTDAGTRDVRRGLMTGLQKSYRVIVSWRRGIQNALYTGDNQAINVPIYVSLALIGGYLALGALMFGLWEKDWNFLIGCYFCFITLSTIGFGDFVPGTSLDASASQAKLVLCSMYLVFGLALLSMCFDLMQQEARKFFQTLGQKLGLMATDVSSDQDQTQIIAESETQGAAFDGL